MMLVMPLVLYGVGYAYAQVSTQIYERSSTHVIVAQRYSSFTAWCDVFDYVTGGGYNVMGGWRYDERVVSSMSNTEGEQQGWLVTIFGMHGGSEETITVYARCMPPITVAGIGVPEFGSFYILLSVVVGAYFVLFRLRSSSVSKFN